MLENWEIKKSPLTFYLYNEVLSTSRSGLAQAYRDRWSDGGCMSPTMACQQERYDADMATRGGAVQGIYPDALLIGAPTAAARFVAVNID